MSATAEKITASHILDALKERAGEKVIWAEELAFSSGARRCDFWKLNPHASKGYLATAYEIKISRADFKKDTHEKQRDARLYSDEFYYITPPGLVSLEEVPDWAGLIEWDGSQMRVRRSAPRRDKDAPSWELVVSIMRYSGQVRRDTDIQSKRIANLEWENKRLNDSLRSCREHAFNARMKQIEGGS